MSVWTTFISMDRLERARYDALRERIRTRTARRNTDGTVQALAAEVEALQRLVRAMVDLLKSKGLLDPAALAEAMDRIDREDGVADGRVTPPEPIPPAASPTRRRARR